MRVGRNGSGHLIFALQIGGHTEVQRGQGTKVIEPVSGCAGNPPKSSASQSSVFSSISICLSDSLYKGLAFL